MIEAVIFDMDGVLADTEYYYENRRKNFLLENGIHPGGQLHRLQRKPSGKPFPQHPSPQEMLMAYREYRAPPPYQAIPTPLYPPLRWVPPDLRKGV